MAAPRVLIENLPEQPAPEPADLLVVQNGAITKKMQVAALTTLTSAPIAEHIADDTAHAASAITAQPNAAPMTGTDVQTQLSQIAAELIAVRESEHIEVGPVPPSDTEWLWADTTEGGSGVGTQVPEIYLFPSGDESGVTDLANFSAARGDNSPRVITLAPGQYYVNGLTLLMSNHHWRGPGAVVKLADGSPTCSVFDFPNGNQMNCSIRDITIDGNKANLSNSDIQAAIQLIIATNGVVSGVKIINAKNAGISAYLGTNLLIENCEIYDTGVVDGIISDHSPIRTFGSTDVRVIGNRVKNCRDNGLGINAKGHTLIANNTVQNCTPVGAIGIALGSNFGPGDKATVTGNIVSDVGGNGVDTGDALSVSISGNTFYNIGQAAICPDPSTNPGVDLDHSYVGNSITNANTGVAIIGNITQQHRGVSIVGNTMGGTIETGIFMSCYRGVTISGNVIMNATARAIHIYSGGVATIGNQYVTITGNMIRGPGIGIVSDTDANDYIIVRDNIIADVSTPYSGLFGANCVLADNVRSVAPYLDAMVGTASTPDPGPLPAECCFVFKVRSTTPIADTCIVASQDNATQRSWGISRETYTSELYWTEGPDGSGAGQTNIGLVVPTGRDEVMAVSYDQDDSGLKRWRVYNSATFVPVSAGQTGALATVFEATIPVSIGTHFDGAHRWAGRIYWVEMRTGLNPKAGQVIWRFDAADYPGTGTSYVDPRGRTWTLTSAAAIVRP